MALHQIPVSALIPHTADQLYEIVADYHSKHPLILPAPYFVSLKVMEGGFGSGTVIEVQTKLMGKTQKFQARISEPVPGRMLAETIQGRGMVTQFLLEPQLNGRETRVTIKTILPVHPGWAGKIEGWFASRLLRPVYEKELAQLAEVAAGEKVPVP